jgi:SAM-dependent methyltransferase
MNKLYRKFRNDVMKDKPEEILLQIEMDRILEYETLLGKAWKGKVLDLGCGLDTFTKACSIKGFDAEGVDIDKCDFETGPLSFQNESKDIITLHDVLEHVWNPKNLFNEINRVLPKGGYLILTVHDWKTNHKTFYNDPTRKRPYTAESLKKLFMVFGMKIHQIKLKGGRWPWNKKTILAIAQRMR